MDKPLLGKSRAFPKLGAFFDTNFTAQQVQLAGQHRLNSKRLQLRQPRCKTWLRRAALCWIAANSVHEQSPSWPLSFAIDSYTQQLPSVVLAVVRCIFEADLAINNRCWTFTSTHSACVASGGVSLSCQLQAQCGVLLCFAALYSLHPHADGRYTTAMNGMTQNMYIAPHMHDRLCMQQSRL